MRNLEFTFLSEIARVGRWTDHFRPCVDRRKVRARGCEQRRSVRARPAKETKTIKISSFPYVGCPLSVMMIMTGMMMSLTFLALFCCFSTVAVVADGTGVAHSSVLPCRRRQQQRVPFVVSGDVVDGGDREIASCAATTATVRDGGESDDVTATKREGDLLLNELVCDLRGGGWLFPRGWNPFGYTITSLGERFLSFEGSLESDVGRFLASLKGSGSGGGGIVFGRKRYSTLKGQWLEVLRVSKTGQSMRIYKNIDALIKFCLQARLID